MGRDGLRTKVVAGVQGCVRGFFGDGRMLRSGRSAEEGEAVGSGTAGSAARPENKAEKRPGSSASATATESDPEYADVYPSSSSRPAISRIS